MTGGNRSVAWAVALVFLFLGMVSIQVQLYLQWRAQARIIARRYLDMQESNEKIRRTTDYFLATMDHVEADRAEVLATARVIARHLDIPAEAIAAEKFKLDRQPKAQRPGP
jgi:hypothetical protein